MDPGDDVARFVEWFTIDEEARYLALDAIGASGHDVELKVVVCCHGTPIGSDAT